MGGPGHLRRAGQALRAGQNVIMVSAPAPPARAAPQGGLPTNLTPKAPRPAFAVLPPLAFGTCLAA